jgi:hypothetical protein
MIGEVSGLEFRPISALTTLPAEPPWCWRGFLAGGWVTLLTGDAFAGKSTLTAGLLTALARGVPFLGYETARTTAVWVSEEDDHGLAAKAQRFGLIGEQGTILGRRQLAGVGMERLVEQAAKYARDHGHGLLVVDSFAGLARLQGEEENHAGAVTEKLRLLQDAAALGLAVLLTHHTPKGGKGPRGSGAFRAAADIAIEYTRERKSNRFSLTTESRGGAAADLRGSLITKGEWSFRPLGVAKAYDKARSVSRPRVDTDSIVWDALPHGIENGLSYAQIGEQTGLSLEQVENRLRAWEKAGKEGLARDDGPTGKPARGRPSLWYRTSTN